MTPDISAKDPFVGDVPTAIMEIDSLVRSIHSGREHDEFDEIVLSRWFRLQRRLARYWTDIAPSS